MCIGNTCTSRVRMGEVKGSLAAAGGLYSAAASSRVCSSKAMQGLSCVVLRFSMPGCSVRRRRPKVSKGLSEAVIRRAIAARGAAPSQPEVRHKPNIRESATATVQIGSRVRCFLQTRPRSETSEPIPLLQALPRVWAGPFALTPGRGKRTAEGPARPKGNDACTTKQRAGRGEWRDTHGAHTLYSERQVRFDETTA